MPRAPQLAAVVAALALAVLAPDSVLAAVRRINHAGRILGTAQTVTSPTLFNTAAADVVMSSLQLMPTTNTWNEDVSRLPLASNSDSIIAQIIASLSASHRYLDPEAEMNFVIVSGTQAGTQIKMVNYPDESDGVNTNTGIGSYPFTAASYPIESWPRGTGSTTLTAWQTGCFAAGNDCHAIILQPDSTRFLETWKTRVTSNTPAWQAANGAIFDYTSNALRPAGYTSGDAAGLPMLPALVRYDECQRGVVEHALRVVVQSSRGVYYYPGTHKTGSNTDANYPAMGQRLRLKSSFTAGAGWTKCEKAVVKALQTYGCIVADNGNFFSFSYTPDDRYAANEFDNLKSILITSFEVVDPAAVTATSGPRSAGAFTAAMSDVTIGTGRYATLAVTVTGAATDAALCYQWSLYAYPGDTSVTQPGNATFASPNSATTDVSFTATAGTYTIIVSVSDGIHANAYAVALVTVDGSTQGGTPLPMPSGVGPFACGTTPGGGGGGDCCGAQGFALPSASAVVALGVAVIALLRRN